MVHTPCDLCILNDGRLRPLASGEHDDDDEAEDGQQRVSDGVGHAVVAEGGLQR